MEATTTITAEVGTTFTHSAWVEGDTHFVFDVEVGPRLTFRRTRADEVKVGDRLMDTFGQPTVEVLRVTHSPRKVSLITTMGLHTSYTRAEVLNVFVSREDVRPVFASGVTSVDAL